MAVRIAALLMCLSALAAAQEPRVSIATYRGDKVAAVSYTFDDAIQQQVDVAIPILEDAGFHATFYASPGLLRDKATDPQRDATQVVPWETWALVLKKGHEVGNHGMTHANLVGLDAAKLKVEVSDAADLYEKKLGQRPLSFAYPFCGVNPQVKDYVLKFHAVSRTQCDGWGGTGWTVAKPNKDLDDTIARKAWMVPLIHGIDSGYSPVTTSIFREHIKYAKGKEDKLWVDTFANVGRYIEEQNKAQLTVETQKAGQVKFSVSCPLDAKQFDVPLSVVIGAKASRPAEVKATLPGQTQPLPVKALEQKIVVDVPPNAQAVTVTWPE